MKKFVDFLAGFKLASTLLLLLLVLTWLATLEQVDYGLYPTLQKYFTWKNFYVLPHINEKTVWIPLPGANWVAGLLFINMFLGGLLKIRKNWRKSGIVLSHFGILFLLVSGGVSQLWEKRGNMALYEGETSNFAQAYHDHSLEISELDENGLPVKVSVIPMNILAQVQKAAEEGRTVKHADLPFSLHLSHYLKNCRPRRVGPIAAGDTPSVDGYALFKMPNQVADETNLNGCYLKVSTGAEALLFTGAFTPYVLEHEGKNYAFSLRKAIWKMPFKVTLDDFNVEFFPSRRPKKFESYITRNEEGADEKVKIYMNHPMRYQGYTFFQASWGPPEGEPDRPLYSVFEVVKNPADQWPLYSLIITSIGLIGHFVFSLGKYISKETRKASNA